MKRHSVPTKQRYNHNNKNVICIIVLIYLNACFIVQVEERKQIVVRLVNSVYAFTFNVGCMDVL